MRSKFKTNKFYKHKFNTDLMIQVKKVLLSEDSYVKLLADWWSCEEPANCTGITQEVIINKEDTKLWREVKQ